MTTNLRKWLAFGTGVGIEICDGALDVSVVRVRPGGVSVLGAARVMDYVSRPATEWGTELSSFLRKLGTSHVAATVVLPRDEVTVRQLAVPGVTDKDLDAAIRFQIDGLHPYPEDEAIYSYVRIRGTDSVLIGITRAEVIDRYSALFAEAGIKTAAFTFSTAAMYSALRVLSSAPDPREFVAVRQTHGETEIYGESAARPVFSARFESAGERAVALAIAELRLPPDAMPVAFVDVLPKPVVFPESHDPSGAEFPSHAFPYAGAMSAACPWIASAVNLLPAERRRSSSRARYVPTAVLGSLLVLLVGALAAESHYEDTRYLNVLQSEIRKLQPVADRVISIDRQISDVRARTYALDSFRRRTRQDLDSIQEVTKLLEPPAWSAGLEMTRANIQLTGEAETAAPLLQKFDASPYFRDTEFTMGINRTASGEGFRLRANREEPVAPQRTVEQVPPQVAPADAAKSASRGAGPEAHR
jgi:hypothetical protein